MNKTLLKMGNMIDRYIAQNVDCYPSDFLKLDRQLYEDFTDEDIKKYEFNNGPDSYGRHLTWLRQQIVIQTLTNE